MSESQSAETIEKLKDAFDEMVVYKDSQKNNFVDAFKLPSFMRDWVVKSFQDADDGSIDVEGAVDFIQKRIPKKEDWKPILNRVVDEQEEVKFLTKVSVKIDIKTQGKSFALPVFGLDYKDTVIPQAVWEEHSAELLKADETWGVVEIGYQIPESSREKGKIKMTDYQDFCPFNIDLDEFRDARQTFSIDEWIDVVLGAVDYNASCYESENQKLAMITRLLPFVEKRLNMIELAPKGTGKSYLFGSMSRYGWLASGGTMSRAKMFYDISKGEEGLVSRHDYVALDEVQSIVFPDPDEMRGILQGYMQDGRFRVGTHESSADSGVVLLGNIPKDSMNEYLNMFKYLPEVFQASALIDRFHGFLKGWEIPRMNDDLKMRGWALNAEYFATVMHMLRDEANYRAVVDELIVVPEKADTRDTEAIKRICTGYLKLLFPHVRNASDISPRDFNRYCLKRAMDMRAIIILQLAILDPGDYGGKSVPNLSVRDDLQ